MRKIYILYIITFALLSFSAKPVFAVIDSICDASFTYEVYEELGKPSVIQFKNTSAGNPTQISWDFGDGSISNVSNPIHFFPENNTYQVRLIIANDISSDEIIQEIEINVPLSINFEFKLDSNNRVPNTFIFTAEIDGYYDQLTWNFSDQILQNVVDTIHSYPEQDKDYQVTLTARYHFNDTSTMTKALAKGLTTYEYYNIGGQVYLGDSLMNNPVSTGDRGIAYLYRLDNDVPVLVDTNQFANLGYYWFANKLKAHYIIQITLTEESDHFDQFAPTYVGNTSFWDEAEIINLAQDKYREDLILKEKTNSKMGDQSLNGWVKDLIEIHENQNALIYLYDTEDHLIDYKIAKANDYYEFDLLPQGHYLLEADITGVPTKPKLIYIGGSKDYDLKSALIQSTHKVFPNPAKDYTILNMDNRLEKHAMETHIFNANGQLIKKEYHSLKSGLNYIRINLKGLPSGILYIKTPEISEEVIKLIH
jgi:hypothetical protein